MDTFLNRIIRAAKLDVHLFEEVEADSSAMGQATLVVILSSLAAGIGNGLELGFWAVIVNTIAALVGWYVWAFMTYFIGTKFIPEPQTEADQGQLLRTIGFSSSPGIIRVLGIVPGLGSVISFIASVWMLVAMIIAVRQALDYKSTLRAVVVCLIGWFVYMLILWLFLLVFGIPAGV